MKKIEWKRLEISSRKLEIQGNISCKDGHNKGQKCMDLTEAEEVARIHRRTVQKELHDPENHDDVITHTHLEPEVLECEVK